MQIVFTSILLVTFVSNMSAAPPKTARDEAPSAAPEIQVIPVTCNPSIQRCY